MIQFSSVQWPHGLQHARLPCSSLTPRAYSQLMSIESVMPSNHLILCWPLLLPLSIFPSIRVFSNESVLHIRWSKYWSFSFSVSPSKEYSGLVSFRTRNGNNCLFSTQYWTPTSASADGKQLAQPKMLLKFPLPKPLSLGCGKMT